MSNQQFPSINAGALAAAHQSSELDTAGRHRDSVHRIVQHMKKAFDPAAQDRKLSLPHP
jgi:hypothetical protein